MDTQYTTLSKLEDAMNQSQPRRPDTDISNPINTMLSSLAVLPSAEQAFSTDPSALSQNGAAFLGILADLHSSIKSMDSLAFSGSPQSVVNKHALPSLSLFKTPLRDRKRVRQARDEESQLLNTGLNVKPRLVMVPTVPLAFRAEIKAEEAWSSESQLQSTLDRYHGSKLAQSSDSTVTFHIEEWQVSTSIKKLSAGEGKSMERGKQRLLVYLKVDMGLRTGLWGYICFGRRKRRYDGRYQNRERGNELASLKRIKTSRKADQGSDPDENDEGEAVIATRFHLFSEVENNKGKNDLSDFRWIQELCMHMNHLELSLPELLHRLPAYSNMMQEPCQLCSSLLKRGVPPVRRAYLPPAKIVRTVDSVSDGIEEDGSRLDTEMRTDDPAAEISQSPENAYDSNTQEQGQWVAFHSSCLSPRV